VGDSNITLSVTLNEASIAHYIVSEHPSSLPTPAQVRSLRCWGRFSLAAMPVMLALLLCHTNCMRACMRAAPCEKVLESVETLALLSTSAPSLQVAAGTAANSTAPATAGNLTVAAAAATQLSATGLAPGRYYDVYLVAADSPAGNLQSSVLNFTYVTTSVLYDSYYCLW
jgi:hypothetical protein